MSGAIAGTTVSRAASLLHNLHGRQSSSHLLHFLLANNTLGQNVIGTFAGVTRRCIFSGRLPVSGSKVATILLRLENFFRRNITTSFCTPISHAVDDRKFSSSAQATEEALKNKPAEEKISSLKKTEIGYEELLTFINTEVKYIFDVRDPSEIEETGMIPNAINLPLTKLKASLQMLEEEFQSDFKLKKPSPEESNLIVFYGLSAVKSSTALEIAHKLGYKKARQYSGGFEEWRLKAAEK